jgi:5-methylcytosine-specific restriction protein A
MSTYLLIWNPKNYHYEHLHDQIDEIREYGAAKSDWSTGSRKNIQPGDSLYLMRLGVNPRGIIGFGVATSYVYQLAHWGDSNRDANYVSLDLHALLDAETQSILDLETLKKSFPEFGWTPQGSGVHIPDEIAESLHTHWAQLIAQPSSQYAANLPHETSDRTQESAHFIEGAMRELTLTRRERNPAARAYCLAMYGTRCSVCDFSFEDLYGEIGVGYMQVHHLDPLATTAGSRTVDPERDLRPVCPNCHAMLHRRSPPYSIEELKAILRR